MGMSSALYSGVSGINANGQAISVIGNNLANTNTVAFKGSRAVFADLLSSTINGSGGISQVGRGVGLSKVDQVFTQGTFESTESPLDVAIEGEGFFILKEVGDETNYYSRAGSFRFDDSGYLINPEGLHVMGKLFGTDGKLLPGDATSIRVKSTGLIQGQATDALKLITNLDSAEPVIAAAFAYDDPATYNYSSSMQVFDTLGNPHLVSTYFKKTGNNAWDVYYSYENQAVPPVVTTALLTNLTFTTDGILTNAALDPPVDTTAVTPAIDWVNGTTPTALTYTFDCTQYNSDSVVISQEQNGLAAGNLTDIKIDSEGVVIASYSNGKETKIAQLVLGKFVNPTGLFLVGNNLYTETETSGPVRTGIPGPELGKVFTNSLEQSNVDVSVEFVRMITAQRAFQANSKIITTVDELLSELINLKR